MQSVFSFLANPEFSVSVCACVNYFLMQLQFVSWEELLLFAVAVLPLWRSFPAVCDLSRPREVSEWPRPSFPKTVTNIAQHLAFPHRVSSCLSLRVRVLGAAAVGLSSV